jgi:hypothetical protein
MTATDQAVQNILEATGQQQASDKAKEAVRSAVSQYYAAKGSMAKSFTVGLIIDALGIKYGDNAAKIAPQLM